MTLRLYYSDSYLRSFPARIVGREEGGHRVYLDQTAFYPTSGGQLNDRGTLGEAQVVDVIDEGERIAHVLDRPWNSADEVVGTVNWSRRFDHMQQHTGQHLLSAICHDRFNWPTLSVHFGDDTSTIDLDTGSAAPEQLLEIEQRANAAITGNHSVSVTYEPASEARDLRKTSEREGTLRVVTIEGLDRSACGGTHVRHTGEIGAILLGKSERMKQKVRLEFLCGARAMRQARLDANAVAAVARQFSASAAEVPVLLEKLVAEHRTERTWRQRLTADLAQAEAATFFAGATPGPDGLRRIALTRPDVESIRALAQALTERERVLFVGIASDARTVLVATSADSGCDAGALLKPLLAAHGGRGGGSARLAQGVADVSALDAIAQTIVRTR